MYISEVFEIIMETQRIYLGIMPDVFSPDSY